MIYLNTYNIFESVQQFDKLLKAYMNTNSDYDNYGLYKLKDKLQSEGLIAYLGPITKIILNGDDTDFFEDDVDDIVDGIKFLKKNNIDIAKLNISDISDFNDTIYNLGEKVSIKQYINRWAPASLRKDAVKDWEKLFDYREEIEANTIPEDLLKKGSRFNTANEWINYIIGLFNGDGYDLDELKNSNIKIFYENDEILIYKPLDFKSYMIVGYKYWCTMSEVTFNYYLKDDLILCLNKKDITDSLISYIDDKKRINIYNYINNSITNNIPDKYQFDAEKMKSYHKLYGGLYESFNSTNIEENLDSLLADLTDIGFGYETNIKDETYFYVEIFKGSTPVNEREPFDYDDREETQFDLIDIIDEVEYIVEYMMAKLGNEYTCEYEYEDSWEQHTFYDLQEENAQDIVSLTITFRKKT